MQSILKENTLREFVGYQDQIHASFGGFNEIEIFKNKIKVKKILNDRNLRVFEKKFIFSFYWYNAKSKQHRKKKGKENKTKLYKLR